MAENRIQLAELLNFVSEQVRAADERAKSDRNEPVMKFMECEIDCAIDIEMKADGGIHVWVVNLGGGAKRTESNTIKVKYSALPQEFIAATLSETAPAVKPKRHGIRVEDNDSKADDPNT